MNFFGFFGWGLNSEGGTPVREESSDDSYEVISSGVMTANGAPSYETTGDPRLDLFGKVCRDTPIETLHHILEASWNIDRLDTLRLIFYIRDCRGGTGERQQFYNAVTWLYQKDPKSLIHNLEHVPFYGRYKDLLQIGQNNYDPRSGKWNHVCLVTGNDEHIYNIRFYIYEIFATTLNRDLCYIENGNGFSISLAAKYAPSEKDHYDKAYKAVSGICSMMGISKADYRKKYLTPLRSQLKIVEQRMTEYPEDWSSINFSHVPAIALKKYKKAWERHEGERYRTWLQDVKTGKRKMNVLRLMPYQIVEPYLTEYNRCYEEDPTVEAQWAAFVDQTRKNLKARRPRDGDSLRVVSVIDTSESMYSIGKGPSPITVALSLGLLLAELTEGPFANKFITFSSSPQIQNIEGESLLNKLQDMATAKWGMSTNIEAVFELIIHQRLFSNVEVDTVFIFSDMQFDTATGLSGNTNTNFNLIDAKFEAAEMTRPRLVFWNVNGTTLDFPVPSKADRTAYISGFSADIFNSILEGRDLNPIDLMLSIIRSDRYSRITLP